MLRGPIKQMVCYYRIRLDVKTPGICNGFKLIYNSVLFDRIWFSLQWFYIQSKCMLLYALTSIKCPLLTLDCCKSAKWFTMWLKPFVSCGDWQKPDKLFACLWTFLSDNKNSYGPLWVWTCMIPAMTFFYMPQPWGHKACGQVDY